MLCCSGVCRVQYTKELLPFPEFFLVMTWLLILICWFPRFVQSCIGLLKVFILILCTFHCVCSLHVLCFSQCECSFTTLIAFLVSESEPRECTWGAFANCTPILKVKTRFLTKRKINHKRKRGDLHVTTPRCYAERSYATVCCLSIRMYI